ncbi:MAG TPA: tetratricopeptide repeat protein [Rhodanobacteraceae bacterium]|nr:tetratricopeptide repeat protein [Rhodanobacteraceae bacterium]
MAKKPKSRSGASTAGQERAHARSGPVVAPARRSGDLWILAALAITTLAIYAQVVGHSFIDLDDPLYIRDNPVVGRGLTLPGIAWAFTTFHAANWHPLTWLSHMLDVELFGLDAGRHLLVNVLIHVANTLLLFRFLRRTTGTRWPSAMVAALFALHPLHVESVAWAAERKDTLAAFFGLLTLIAHARYVEAASLKRYLAVVLCLALGLMAKPMLVTWPFVLLLLDYWPLRRIAWHSGEGFARFARDVKPLLVEKIPLFAIVAASMVVTYVAQSHGGAVRALVDEPFSLRAANAVVSCAKYLVGTVWPHDLAVYYPFNADIPAGQIAASLLLVGALTAFALANARTRPYLAVGWLWFLGTLVPVIGLVQVGGQALADRYHYLPSIGLFIAIVFGVADVAAVKRIGAVALAAVAGIVLAAFATLTAFQAALWKDSVTLFEHTLAVTTDNLVIEYNLGHVLGEEKKYAEASAHFAEALRIDPDFLDALINMGMTLASEGKPDEAIGYFERALKVAPRSSKAHTQIALARMQEGRPDDALAEFRRAVELGPDDADAHDNLGLMLARQGKADEAMREIGEALRIDPGSADAHNNMGLVLLASGRARESIVHFDEALRLKPDFAVARQNLARAQAMLGTRAIPERP